VATNDQAQHLNRLVREQLIAAGEVNVDREATVRGGQAVGVGDEIATRQNEWGLRAEHGGHVKNRHRWRVQAVGADGSLTVSDPDRGQVTLPPGYVRDSAELAYFRSTHGVQSLTQDVGGSLVDVNSGHRDVYVGMTRGRVKNTAYVVCEADQTPEQVLQAALRRDRADLGVLAASERLAEDLRLERQRQDAEHATAARAPAVAVPDRLAGYRRALGDQHAAWLADRARALALTAASMDQEILLSERARLAPAAQSLDRKVAMEAGRALRDRDLALRRAQGALAAAQALRGEAAQAGGLRSADQVMDAPSSPPSSCLTHSCRRCSSTLRRKSHAPFRRSSLRLMGSPVTASGSWAWSTVTSSRLATTDGRAFLPPARSARAGTPSQAKPVATGVVITGRWRSASSPLGLTWAAPVIPAPH